MPNQLAQERDSNCISRRNCIELYRDRGSEVIDCWNFDIQYCGERLAGFPVCQARKDYLLVRVKPGYSGLCAIDISNTLETRTGVIIMRHLRPFSRGIFRFSVHLRRNLPSED